MPAFFDFCHLSVNIEYHFELPGGESYSFYIDPARGHTADRDSAEHPFWTKLDYAQCPNCPLKTADCTYCPVAVDLEEVVERFSAILSVTDVKIWVVTPQRHYYKECDAQTGLDSLLGLIMATSACPVLGGFRTMAKTHLPFSTHFESTWRSVGSYLIKQYFAQRDGKKPDLELKGMIDFYEEINTVNQHFADRVRDASQKDASVNAVIQLSALSITLQASLEEQLDEFRDEFFG